MFCALKFIWIHVTVDRSKIRALKRILHEQRRQHSNASGFGLEPEDLNTDGIDASGSNIYVHDCVINNDDDSIAVKPCSSNKCRLQAAQEHAFRKSYTDRLRRQHWICSTRGSTTLRPKYYLWNINMPDTGKGIYIKSNPSCDDSNPSKTAIIRDILYEDIVLQNPSWWAIWIGPQQQHEPGQGLQNKCPLLYPLVKPCPTQGCVTFQNITLRRVNITNPSLSPGVILGNASNKMRDITFEDVTVTEREGGLSMAKLEASNIIGGKALGTTSPIPPGFTREE